MRSGRLGAFAALLTIAACSSTNVIVQDSVRTYPATEKVEILRTPPDRSYERLATLVASQSDSGPLSTGGGLPAIYKELGDKAKAIGADAVIITNESTRVVKNDVIYTITGSAVRYSDTGTPPDDTLRPTQGPQAAGEGGPLSRPAAPTGNWIRDRDPAHYTIQLLAARNEQAVIRFMKEHHLGTDAGYFKMVRDNEAWYAVVYGAFPTREAAKRAAQSLPAAIRSASPWIRKFADVQKIAVN